MCVASCISTPAFELVPTNGLLSRRNPLQRLIIAGLLLSGGSKSLGSHGEYTSPTKMLTTRLTFSPSQMLLYFRCMNNHRCTRLHLQDPGKSVHSGSCTWRQLGPQAEMYNEEIAQCPTFQTSVRNAVSTPSWRRCSWVVQHKILIDPRMEVGLTHLTRLHICLLPVQLGR